MPIKRKKTCWCSAYPWPHRCGGGKCKKTRPVGKTKRNVAAMKKRNKKYRKKARHGK